MLLNWAVPSAWCPPGPSVMLPQHFLHHSGPLTRPHTGSATKVLREYLWPLPLDRPCDLFPLSPQFPHGNKSLRVLDRGHSGSVTLRHRRLWFMVLPEAPLERSPGAFHSQVPPSGPAQPSCSQTLPDPSPVTKGGPSPRWGMWDSLSPRQRQASPRDRRQRGLPAAVICDAGGTGPVAAGGVGEMGVGRGGGNQRGSRLAAAPRRVLLRGTGRTRRVPTALPIF